MNVEYLFLIVGAGGTGGNFAKEFARYMRGFLGRGKSLKAVLIDGDIIEQKNVERQPFINEDVSQNKALALSDAIKDNFHLAQWYSYPHFIDNEEQLLNLIKELTTNDYGTKTIPVIVGCVDNHRARQCMHAAFEKLDTCFYLDSANEFSVGEVVIAAKIEGRIIAPDRSFYYPDVLADNSPSASELSCSAVNVSSPQHLATNLMAANLLLSSVVSIVSENNIPGGIIYFDREKLFSRLQPFDGGKTHE